MNYINDFHKILEWILEYESEGEEAKIRKKLLINLYEEFIRINTELNDIKGIYGIMYKTIHDDSSYADTNYIWFISEEDRDIVLSNHKRGVYYDKIFDTDMPYRLYGLNLHDFKKVIKLNNIIYSEI